jgi:hypothetical protein
LDLFGNKVRQLRVATDLEVVANGCDTEVGGYVGEAVPDQSLHGVADGTERR